MREDGITDIKIIDPPSNLLAPALVRRCAPLGDERRVPYSREKSVRICDVSLYSVLRRQIQRS